MTSADIHTSLLRPAVLQILRAAGFNHARPAVVDTVTDLAARYLLLIATSSAQNAFSTHNSFVPTVQDVRLALSEAGALFPQMSAGEEQMKDSVEVDGEMVPFEDLRGVRAFVEWAQGDVNKSIRRIAGFGGDEMNVEQIAAGTDEKEDYLTAMKKNGKEAEDTRYHGTALGKDSELQSVPIVGGPVTSISEWVEQFRAEATSPRSDMKGVDEEAGAEGATPATSILSTAPPTPAQVEDEAQTPMSQDQSPT